MLYNVIFLESCDPKITWHGSLPRKILIEPEYSVKVFIGGVPWDITEVELLASFGTYGNVTVEWPGKDCDHSKHPPKGYVYLIFNSSESVKKLLQNCSRSDDKYYQLVSSRQRKSKEVQVIPWALNDSNALRIASSRLDIDKTIFVGGLHGMLNADGLMHIMDDLFGGVVYAGIDTDQYKYPIGGSGRVIFSNRKSYIKAVNAAFVEIRTKKFKKRIQLDPYLRDAMCTQCHKAPGPYFCRDSLCWAYYCKTCWNLRHRPASLADHRAMKRTSNKTKSRPIPR
ncbi:uncharacterized protein TRIADDRAFT_30543 [Trichoplax adhaerens]|uniref:RRM domain-containing protein n=1 Tax=Trichoplax adhaerens TaxID=10228 RepID=B3S7U4_TRIAD|nr:hypothetical protein TRIADDRAFT_30543 [Trichoplax adhaerens]EDV21354.1 hypothetical protein TRIADDRAFT_30543 [Trichoplax adhaerens]|eukprot:XP_002116321.1 hypothetical protein TRIADDRAFT_30543 [Trichoplax adhaerens]